MLFFYFQRLATMRCKKTHHLFFLPAVDLGKITAYAFILLVWYLSSRIRSEAKGGYKHADDDAVVWATGR